MHGCFEPYPSIVGNGNWGICQFGIVGGPGGMNFSSWNLLSTNIVECVCCVFGRDTIPSLCLDVKWASEDFKFFLCWEDDSECCISPVWGQRHLCWEACLNVTDRLWCCFECQGSWVSQVEFDYYYHTILWV